MKPLLILMLLAFIAGITGCIQEHPKPTISERQAIAVWEPDGIIETDEYARSMVLHGYGGHGLSGGDIEVSWKNDDQYIYLGLKGNTTGWLSIGFEPSEWMKDADILWGAVNGSSAILEDQYSVNNYGPHPKDTELGGTNDIVEGGGKEENGITVLEFKRKLNTGDKFDKILKPGQKVSIIWGMANSDSEYEKHDIAIGEAVLELQENDTKNIVNTSSNLTDEEAKGAIYILNEEKMARDVYLSFYREYDVPIFKNIAASEQNHMDAARGILKRYGIFDPVGEEQGVFEDVATQTLYDSMIADGNGSEEKALKTAAGIEEMSIKDLQQRLASTNKTDITIVYNGLLFGSEKHLRSYVRRLDALGYEYSPIYLTQENYNETVFGKIR